MRLQPAHKKRHIIERLSLLYVCYHLPKMRVLMQRCVGMYSIPDEHNLHRHFIISFVFSSCYRSITIGAISYH